PMRSRVPLLVLISLLLHSPLRVWAQSSPSLSRLGFQPEKKLRLDRSTPEGQFLELVALETDTGRRAALLEQFTVMFPKYPQMILSQEKLLWAYQALEKWDKVFAIGEQILLKDSNNIEICHMLWQTAEKHAGASAAKWKQATLDLAGKIVRAPKPTD